MVAMLLCSLALVLPASLQLSGADQVWAFVDYGKQIGSSGLLVRPGLRGPEIFVSASRHPGGYVPDYWYVLTRRTDRSPCEYVSPHQPNFVAMEFGDLLGAGAPQLVLLDLASGITVLDPDTREVLQRFTLPLSGPDAMTLGDSDHDGREEIHVLASSTLSVFDGAGALEWTRSGSGSHLAIGQMDGDPALEICTTSRVVIDGVTRQVEWTWPLGFAIVDVAAADVDGDGLEEIVVAEDAPRISVLDVDLRTIKWNRTTAEIKLLALHDLDGDAVAEILAGEKVGGGVVGYEGIAGVEFCRIPNPGAEVSGITAADVDLDGEIEVLFGSVVTYGSDSLVIADWRTAATEWRSERFEGPFIGPRIGDLTGDGLPEVVTATQDGILANGVLLVFDGKDLDLLGVSDPVTTVGVPYGLQDIELRDLDQDGVLEILVATGEDREGVLLAYRYAAGAFIPMWTNATRPPNTAFMHVDAADLDGDGSMEIVGAAGNVWIHAPDPAVYVYDFLTGQERWRSPPFGGRLDLAQGLELGDFDHDGHVEIATFVRWRTAHVFDPVTRQVEALIPGFHAFMTSFMHAGVPTLLISDDFSNIALYQVIGGSYQMVYADNLGVTGLGLLQRGPRDLFWVGGFPFRLMDLNTRVVHWTAPDHRFTGSAVVSPPRSEIEFMMVADSCMVGFRAR